jgi:thiamine pyrophosphokinase
VAHSPLFAPLTSQFPLLLIGGLSGRIDQTIHTISLLHKLRHTRPVSYVLSGESLAWVLDSGTHLIEIDHNSMGQTCGLLPVGVDSAMVTTKGLKWNLGKHPSNHVRILIRRLVHVVRWECLYFEPPLARRARCLC